MVMLNVNVLKWKDNFVPGWFWSTKCNLLVVIRSASVDGEPKALVKTTAKLFGCLSKDFGGGSIFSHTFPSVLPNSFLFQVQILLLADYCVSALVTRFMFPLNLLHCMDAQQMDELLLGIKETPRLFGGSCQCRMGGRHLFIAIQLVMILLLAEV